MVLPDLISDCCMKIKVESYASIYSKSILGTYAIEQDLVNGKHTYTSTFKHGKYGIWYSKHHWIIGFTSDRGLDNGFHSSYHRSSYSCPNGVKAKGVKIICE